MKKTIIFKPLLSVLFMVMFSFSNANTPIDRIINSKEFIQFSIKHQIDTKVFSKNTIKVTELKEINSNLYTVSLPNDERLYIIENYEKNFAEYLYEKNAEGISQLINKNDVDLFKLKSTMISVDPSTECIQATVKYIKDTCNSNATCQISCDIMSTHCTAYTYTLAYAHCAANNNQPPKKQVSTISASIY